MVLTSKVDYSATVLDTIICFRFSASLPVLSRNLSDTFCYLIDILGQLTVVCFGAFCCCCFGFFPRCNFYLGSATRSKSELLKIKCPRDDSCNSMVRGGFESNT